MKTANRRMNFLFTVYRCRKYRGHALLSVYSPSCVRPIFPSIILKIGCRSIGSWASTLFIYGHPDPLDFLMKNLPKKWHKTIRAACAQILLGIVEGERQ